MVVEYFSCELNLKYHPLSFQNNTYRTELHLNQTKQNTTFPDHWVNLDLQIFFICITVPRMWHGSPGTWLYCHILTVLYGKYIVYTGIKKVKPSNPFKLNRKISEEILDAKYYSHE